MTVAACEAVWLKRILKDLGVPIKDPTPLYCDNMSSIYLFQVRTKHIEVHYHFIRECILVGDVDLQHINTNLQTADIFTKALGANKLWQFMMMSLSNLKWSPSCFHIYWWPINVVENQAQMWSSV